MKKLSRFIGELFLFYPTLAKATAGEAGVRRQGLGKAMCKYANEGICKWGNNKARPYCFRQFANSLTQ